LIVDEGNGQPIMTFQSRRADEVVVWFRSRTHKALLRVAVGVLDMSKAFCPALKEVFGAQGHIIDRFHVVPQAVEALDAVLGSAKKQLDKDAANALQTLRTRWLKSADQLDVDELIARDEWRRRFPELRATLDWGQNVRKWLESNYGKPAREALLKLIERARQSAQEPRRRIARTLTRWCEPISRDMRHRDTNGMTEGFNTTPRIDVQGQLDITGSLRQEQREAQHTNEVVYG